VKVGDMVRVARPSLSNLPGDMGVIIKVLAPLDGTGVQPCYKIHFQPQYTRDGCFQQRSVGESYLEKVVG